MSEEEDTPSPIEPTHETSTLSSQRIQHPLERKRILEAALFLVPDGIPSTVLAKKINSSPTEVANLIEELRREYEREGRCFLILRDGDNYVLTLQPCYMEYVGDLAQQIDLSKGAQKLLAFLSQNEGITQSRLVYLLGAGVYQYKKEAIEKGYLEARKSGRTFTLHTTEKFRQRFGKS